MRPCRTAMFLGWSLAALPIVSVLLTRAALATDDVWSSPPATPGGRIVLRVAVAEDQASDPAAAGKAAAALTRTPARRSSTSAAECMKTPP